ncbi:MAG: MFS transporter, partial [Alphaproteobacteria bacterium]
GTIFSGSSLASGVVSLLIASFMNRLSRPIVAYSGLAVIALGTAAALLSNDYISLLVARMGVGSGLGLMIAASSASFGALRDPDRAAGLTSVLGSLVAAGFVLILPVIAAREGLHGLFITEFVFIACFGLFAFRLPAAPQPSASSSSSPSSTKPNGSFLSKPALLLMGSLALLMVGESAAWVLAERRGTALGLSPERIGIWLGVMNLFGMGGAALVATISTRYGRFGPWGIGMVFLVLGILLVYSAPMEPPWGEAAFGAGLVFWCIGFFLQLPYVMGALSVMDPQGRLGAMKGAAMVFGMSLGPTLGGLIASAFGQSFIGPFAAAVIISSMLLAGPVMRRLDRAT